MIGLVLISETNAAVWRDWDVLNIASYLNSFLQEVLLYSINMEMLHNIKQSQSIQDLWCLNPQGFHEKSVATRC